jgi:hypothetical protein
MKNADIRTGALLSLMLATAIPGFSAPGAPGSHIFSHTLVGAPAARQLVQDESNDSNLNPQPDQPSDMGNNTGNYNSDQPSAQPGEDNGESSQAMPPDDNGGESQMNPNPEGSDNPDQNNQNPDLGDQNPDDQQNQQASPDL